MNEPGMPMPPTNLPTSNPPSYLRPPVNFSGRRLSRPGVANNSALLFVVGIAAIVLCIWGYLIFRGSSQMPQSALETAPLKGSIFFLGFDPVPNVYHFVFGAQSKDPVIASPAKAIVENAAITSGLNALALVESSGQTNTLVVTSLTDGSTKTLTTTKGGSISPIWSFDGKNLAFLELTPDALTKSLEFVPFAPTTTSALPPQKLHAALVIQGANGKMATYPIAGRPLGFSIDNKYVLIKNVQVKKSVFFSIVETANGKVTPLSTKIYTVPIIAALSPNGAYLAFKDGSTVAWGIVDWETKAFVKKGSIAVPAEGLSFTPQGELLVYGGAKATGFRLNSGVAEEIGQAALPFKEGVPVLMWIN